MAAQTVTIRPSRARLTAILVALGGLSVILALLAAAVPPGRASLRVALGLAALLAAGATIAFWRGRNAALTIGADGIRDEGGRMIAPLDQVAGVDRGVFAMKPASGFVVRLTVAPGSRWVPGLWWRAGRLLGVGGLAPLAATRAAADLLTALIRSR